MPGLGTGSSPSSCPNRSSSDWPVATSTGPAGYVPHSDPPGVAGAATDGGAATDAARTVNQAAGAMASQPPPPGSLAAKWLVTRVPVAGLAEKCQNPPQLGHVQAGYRSESFGIMRL